MAWKLRSIPSDSTSSAALANAGGIEQLDRNAADGGGFRDHIARGAGDVRHDGAVLLEQAR